MKYLIYFFSIVFLLSLNIAVFPLLKIYGVMPNLLFLFVIIFSLESRSYDFLFIAFLSGIFLDFFSSLYIGSFTISLILLAFGLRFLVRNVVTLEINWKYLSIMLAVSLFLVMLFIWGYNNFFFRFKLSSIYINFKFLLGRFFIEFVYSWILLFPMRKFLNVVKFINLNFFVRQRVL